MESQLQRYLTLNIFIKWWLDLSHAPYDNQEGVANFIDILGRYGVPATPRTRRGKIFQNHH